MIDLETSNGFEILNELCTEFLGAATFSIRALPSLVVMCQARLLPYLDREYSLYVSSRNLQMPSTHATDSVNANWQRV